MTCAVCLPKPDSDYWSGCACDFAPFPPCDAIAPGLAQLPVQVLGFPQFRASLLSTASLRPELEGWSARAVDDLGVMLLESWAYVLDILEFYDRRIAGECYLRTAQDPASLRRLVGLLGYRPRPAVAASAIVAAIADGPDRVSIPGGTQLRSKAVAGVPAQIFETAQSTLIDPRTNMWNLAPIPSSTKYSGMIAFAPRELGVLPGQIVALTIGGNPQYAGTVSSVVATKMPDGIEYRVVKLNPAPAIPDQTQLESMRLQAMSQNAAPSPFPLEGSTTAQSGSLSSWVLDSLYPQIRADDVVVVETATGLYAARVQSATIASVVLGSVPTTSPATAILGKATQLTFAGNYAAKRIHFRGVAAGRLTNAALADVPVESLIGTRDAAGSYLPVPEGARPGTFAVAGAGKSGVHLAGSVDIGSTGSAELTGQQILASATQQLTVPIRYHGNLIEVTRGETVNEILGSGDSTRPYQKFRLKKKPLTYLPDPSKPGAIAPQLAVRVNGILWRQVDSLVTARKGQRSYIVRHDENGETDIIFGDDVRPQSGVNNITASYRYGAGKAAPPPGELTQIVGKVPGLARVVAPLTVGGGADAEDPAAVKSNAPRSVLTYGRAVSLADYAAMVAGYPGVIASDVQWTWAEGAQTAGVQAWIVADGAAVASGLQAALANAGDPLTPVAVAPATADSHALSIVVTVAADFVAGDVRAAVAASLNDPDTGLLVPANVGIGNALFRSRIARRVAEVAGVDAIADILIDGIEMPNAITTAQGRYLSFTLTVGAS